MTLFTKKNCVLCGLLKSRFDLSAMQVNVEVLDDNNPEALAHLAWHSLVETARKTLPVLVLDDSSTVADFNNIEHHLALRAGQYGISFKVDHSGKGCETGSCAIN